MKTPQYPESTQALGQFIILAMGRVIMIGVIVALVAAWALTEPFYGLSRRIVRGRKLMVKQMKN